MDEDVSTSYWKTTFTVEAALIEYQKYDQSMPATLARVSTFIYFIKVVVSHPEVEVNYPLDTPFRVSSDL